MKKQIGMFNDLDTEILPEGIIDAQLNDSQILIVKILAFYNCSMSKTGACNFVSNIIKSIPKYRNLNLSRLKASFDQLINLGIFNKTSAGIELSPQIVAKIIPLHADNTALVKTILHSLTHASFYYSDEKYYQTRLAILTQDVEELRPLTHIYNSYGWRSDIDQIISPLLELGDLSLIIPFLPSFPKNRLNEFLEVLIFEVPESYFMQLAEIFSDPSIEINDTSKMYYLSCAHLLLEPFQIDELSKSANVEPSSSFFTHLLRGNSQKALEQGALFLSYIQEKEQHKRKELPGIFGVLYAIVLIASGESKNLTIATTFLRSCIKTLPKSNEFENPYRAFARIMLLFIEHKLGKKLTTQQEIKETYGRASKQYFLTAVLKWFGKPLSTYTHGYTLSEKEEWQFRSAGVCEECDSLAFHQERLDNLSAQYNYKALADLYETEELWENILGILENGLSEKKTSTKTAVQPQKRLIWLLDPAERDAIRCLEQTRTKNGWGKGKDRVLGRLISTPPKYTTANDRAIIACFQKSYYGDVFVNNWDKLLKIMAKHEDVYTMTEPHLPLSISIQEAQIQINKNKEGASIKLNPESPHPNVIKESDTNYIFINWSPKAMQVYNVLSESNLKAITIPQKGLKKAKPILDRLNEVMPVMGNFAQSSATIQKSENIPVIQLTPINEQLHVQLLIEVIKDEDARFLPGIGSKDVMIKTAKGEHINVKRNHEAEKKIVHDLANQVLWLQELKSSSAQLFLDDDMQILEFLAGIKENCPDLTVIWPKGERIRVAKAVSINDINYKIKKQNNWFAVEGEVNVNDQLILSIQELLEKSEGGRIKYIQLDDKTYLSIRNDLQKRLAALDVVAHQKGKQLLVHPLGSSTIEGLIDGAADVKTDKLWKNHLKKQEQLKEYKPSLTSNLQADLRPYQEEGVLWLDRLHHWGVGACLADDMGLGKTIQAISLLIKYAHLGPSVVLAPSSVCANWIKELLRFAPTLNSYELKTQKREKELKKLDGNDVLIISYGLVQSNPDLLANRSWNMVILDEAHAIKNAKSIRSKAVMKLDAKFRLITTGTPIQNHLGELWNLFQFINPGMLGSHEQFVRKFGISNSEENKQRGQRELNKYIAPFILRRRKSDVLDDLPEKTEITLQVKLSDEEQAMYETLRKTAVENITNNNTARGAKHLQILTEITKLRQMSCHPKMVLAESEIPSSKLEALSSLVEDLIEANHKALVFSQFTKHLSLIRTMLDQKGISYQYLDGSTPMKQREQAITKFQAGESELFLISLKAGGVGLNLTAADYVIHMDPWWNPAVEDQASDRVHRIGQQRPVTIYRIIAEGTIEEKIVKMHHEKRDLADKLLADTDQSAKISTEELFSLITQKE